jgi:hypothetical protein
MPTSYNLELAFWRDFQRYGPSLYRICRTTLRGWKRDKSESAQSHFTDCLAALGGSVGLLQILDADRAKRLRLG